MEGSSTEHRGKYEHPIISEHGVQPPFKLFESVQVPTSPTGITLFAVSFINPRHSNSSQRMIGQSGHFKEQFPLWIDTLQRQRVSSTSSKQISKLIINQHRLYKLDNEKLLTADNSFGHW